MPHTKIKISILPMGLIIKNDFSFVLYVANLSLQVTLFIARNCGDKHIIVN
jgi:hypothetical protein